MRTKLIPIGNSKGVRIPKALLEQAGFSEDIDLILKNNEIILRAAHSPRENWEKAFSKMAERGDDELLDSEIEDLGNEWDETEWTW